MIYNHGDILFYDTTTGHIICRTGELYTTEPNARPPINGVAYVEIPFGSVDHTKGYISSIDPVTGEPIFKEYDPIIPPSEGGE